MEAGSNNWELNAPSTNPTAPPSPGKRAARNGTGEDGVKKTRRLTLEERTRLMGVLRTGVERGYGYIRIWRMSYPSNLFYLPMTFILYFTY
ncbi:MAG: hypothetical protein QXM16_01275 [Nitrososphaerota archaeon]